MSNQRGRNTRNKPANGPGPFSGPPNFLVAEHNGRKVAVPRNPSYQETIASIKRSIQGLRTVPDDRIIILAHLAEVDDYVQITEYVWPDLSAGLTAFRVDLDNELDTSPIAPSTNHCCITPTPPPYPEGRSVRRNNANGSLTHNMTNQSAHANISVRTLTGRTISCVVELATCTGLELKAMIQDKEGIPPDQNKLTFAGRLVENHIRLSTYGIGNGSVLDMGLFLRGKPVIYLFPPTPTANIQVQLSLTQSWTFSEIYPPTTITTHAFDTNGLAIGQTISWTVDAQPDGELHDQATRREVAYLFWEAHSKPPKLPSSPPITRPSSPTSAPLHLVDPASHVLLPSHSALLPFDKVTGYIDDVLLALGLHTEARTSFITYWLPNLSKHAYIALRFLPQDEYEQTAPLDVIPAPEVKTRVFMLFRGVAEDQVALWSEAAEMTRKDVTMWRDVVGIDIEKVCDKSLFRVLEWGGMEV